MKILLACPYAWDAPGGVQAHVRQLAGALRERGDDVHVIAPARHFEGAGYEEGVALVGRTIGVAWHGSTAPICLSRRSLRRIRTELYAFAPDVVHVHEPLAPSTSMLATLAARAPVVATFHAASERTRALDAMAPLLRVVARRIAAKIAVSSRAAAFAGRAIGACVDVIPNGVDLARIVRRAHSSSTGQAPRRILWVGRLEPRKGFPILVDAFARLAHELDDVRLVVVGTGAERVAIARLPEALQLRVDMLGALSDDALVAQYAAATVFAAPARGQESFGIVLVEAMAAGLPVVASDIGGYREVVRDAVEGLLVAPNDPRSLAAALRRVLTDPALASSLGAAGVARSRAFSWDEIAPRLREVHARVVRERGGRAPARALRVSAA